MIVKMIKLYKIKNINTLLESGNVDVLVLSLVDLVNDPKEIINSIKDKNIPVIFASKRILRVDENVANRMIANCYTMDPEQVRKSSRKNTS